MTKGKISTLVDSETLSNSMMVLINAVYFRGLWKYPFEKTITKGFQLEAKVNEQREFVELTAELHYIYSKPLSAKILRLPYSGRHFSMFVILPFEADGLDNLVDQLDAERLSSEVDRMELLEVHVLLPKFKFNSLIKLKSIVKAVRRRKFKQSFYLV